MLLGYFNPVCAAGGGFTETSFYKLRHNSHASQNVFDLHRIGNGADGYCYLVQVAAPSFLQFLNFVSNTAPLQFMIFVLKCAYAISKNVGNGKTMDI